jgi:hypothetical protein
MQIFRFEDNGLKMIFVWMLKIRLWIDCRLKLYAEVKTCILMLKLHALNRFALKNLNADRLYADLKKLIADLKN